MNHDMSRAMNQSMNQGRYRFYAGAVGWEHPEWLAAWYPPDLPEDWRLAYYAGEFRCVYLPEADWRAQPENILAEWGEGLPEGFRLLLETRQGRVGPEVLAALQGYAFALTPAVEAVRVRWLKPAEDLKALAAELLARPPAAGPLYLLSRAPDLSLLRRVNTLLEILGE